MGPIHDVGIMFYGSADLFGCHWEIIVKLFRQHCKNIKFEKLSEFAKEFIDFISSDKWFDSEATEISSAHIIALAIEHINEGIGYESVMEFRQEIKRESKELIEAIAENDQIISVSKTDFIQNHEKIIKKFSEEILGQKIVNTILKPIQDYVYEFFIRKGCRSGFETGIVIFGYGDEEIFPSICEYVVDGCCCGNLRYWANRSMNLNDRSRKGAIIPFAQADVATTFVEGISSFYQGFFKYVFNAALEAKDDDFIAEFVPDDQKVVEKSLRNKENQALNEELKVALKAVTREEFVNPVAESVHSLPRDEMAAMAEALVDLTSMRRKVDSNLDTVGGAVDVAVISKGEGFVWIKRKTYFDATLNPDYLERRRIRLGQGEP